MAMQPRLSVISNNSNSNSNSNSNNNSNSNSNNNNRLWRQGLVILLISLQFQITKSTNCDDSPTGRFNDLNGTQQPCIWLQARPELVPDYCNLSATDAPEVCPETCGVCSDLCKDDDETYFGFEGTSRNCEWLRLRVFFEPDYYRPRACFNDNHNDNDNDNANEPSEGPAWNICEETCENCELEEVFITSAPVTMAPITAAPSIMIDDDSDGESTASPSNEVYMNHTSVAPIATPVAATTIAPVTTLTLAPVTVAPGTMAPVTFAPVASPVAPIAPIAQTNVPSAGPTVPTGTSRPTVRPTMRPTKSDHDATPAPLAPVTFAPFLNGGVGEIPPSFTTAAPITLAPMTVPITLAPMTVLPEPTNMPSEMPIAPVSPIVITLAPVADTDAPVTAPVTPPPVLAPVTFAPVMDGSEQPVLVPTTPSTIAPLPPPTDLPTANPTASPTKAPVTGEPTDPPSFPATPQPSLSPTSDPTTLPTSEPSGVPTPTPTPLPTSLPTKAPTPAPISATLSPSASSLPTESEQEGSSAPFPVVTLNPTPFPIAAPVVPPTPAPTLTATPVPTFAPTTVAPTDPPTPRPTFVPPTLAPITTAPTPFPTKLPTSAPTSEPSPTPSQFPTPDPTSKPSAEPTVSPSLFPTPPPTNTPTKAPSASPSSHAPSTSPTSRPSFAPVTFPTTKRPTSSPTPKPSGAPSVVPTLDPTGNPTTMPSHFPTAPPTPSPTGEPTLIPSVIPSPAPTPSPSTYPSIHPSQIPSDQPTVSNAPTFTSPPSSSPSMSPRPSAGPSITPTELPTEVPSPSPSLSPTDFSLQVQNLTSVAVLMDLGRTLPMNNVEYKLWRFITAEHIREEVYAVLGEDQIVTLEVDVSILEQTPPFVSPPPTETPSNSPAPSVELETASPTLAPVTSAPFTIAPVVVDELTLRDLVEGGGGLRRSLQQASSDPMLYVIFNVEILLRSVEKNHDIGRYIGGAFNSVDDKQSYIVDLRLTLQQAFDNTISVDVQVPDAVPTPVPTSPPEKATTNIGIIVGMVVVGVSGLALAGFFVYTRKRRRRIQQSEADKDPPRTNVPSASDGRTYAGEINVADEDEVSILTDPYGMGSRGGPGGEGSTVGETIENYEFWKNYRANQTIASYSHEGSDNNILVEEDDDTLRIQYLEEDKFEVDAPAGKLELVLEAAANGVPVVYAIKSTSPLSDQVQVGDRLVSVDGDDVTVLLPSEVSRLISEKSRQSVRRFVFSRPASGVPRGATTADESFDHEQPTISIHDDEGVNTTTDDISTMDGDTYLEGDLIISHVDDNEQPTISIHDDEGVNTTPDDISTMGGDTYLEGDLIISHVDDNEQPTISIHDDEGVNTTPDDISTMDGDTYLEGDLIISHVDDNDDGSE